MPDDITPAAEGGEPQGQPGVTPTDTGNPGQGAETQAHSLYEEFVKELPDAQKVLVEPILKKWDGQVTRKFQDLHSKYSPYEELGSLEDLQRYRQLYELMETNPMQVYELLHQEFGQQVAPQPTQQPQGDEDDGPVGDIPPALQERIDTLENTLKTVAEFLVNNERATEEQQAQAALDDLLESLKQEKPDLDEEFVLLRLARGMDPQQITQEWDQYVQRIRNAGGPPPAPRVLTSGGGVPRETINVKDVPSSELKNLVANLVAQTVGDR